MASIQEFKRIMQTALERTPKEPVNKSVTDEVRAAHLSRWMAGKGVEGDLDYQPTRKTPRDGAYSKAYVPVKKRKGRQTSHVDLLLEGDFYKGFEMDANEQGMVAKSNNPDGKLKGLDRYYSESQIYGIAEDQIDQIGIAMQPALATELEKTIINAL